MVDLLWSRQDITPSSITNLVNMLHQLNLSGLAESIQNSFQATKGQSLPLEGKLKIFKNSLKHTYARWYNRIQPIPYVRGNIYCVHDIYVESGLELVHQPSFFKNDSQSFEESGLVSLKSYRDIFDIETIPSNRILLEGDPGYGKSTVTLQAAHDWCLGNVASPLKNVAVFILLPLRRLGNISSIFEAIRVVLMPAESPLTKNDIPEILRYSLSVVIVFDGYDEYPDKNSVIETDIMKILAGKMFPNVKVVVSTRSSSLPTYLDPSTVTIRLTGFDEKSRDEYIRRTVTGGDKEKSRQITNALNSSPILNDICQVPMFCVLFAHVANDQKGVIEFSSVTSFFKYVIDCLYNHMWKKNLKEPIPQSISEYSKLNRLAFDSLTGKTQMISWPKRSFIETVGTGCYEELLNIGILIVDEIHEIINEPKEYDIHHIKQIEFVRFYHKLFAEWYAARYLSSYAGSFWPFWLKYNLNKINPIDLQFVFRFACGLNKKASSRIIKYLKSVEGGASFASLCFFEQPDDPEEVDETVKGLCSDGMIIRSSDSRLLQRSNIQLLDIASRKKIQVPCLQLDQSFKVAHQNEITLESGLSVPVLSSIEKLIFTTQAEHEISQENMLGVVKYVQRCLQLKTLAFHGKFILPLSLTVETLISNMNSRSITVFWQLLEYVFQLDVSSGKWRLSSTDSLTSGFVEPEEDFGMLRSVCSGEMALRCTDSRLLQRAKIQFLEIASRQKIPLSCLVLDTFLEADQHSITLENGNHVPVLSTLEEMQIRTEKRIEFTQEQIVGLLCYAQQCPKLQTISFIDCLVPLCFPNDSLWPCKSDTLKVLWKPREHEFDLNFTRSRWTLVSQEYLALETKDQHSLTKMCSGTVTLHTNDTNEYHRSVILLLQIAASQQIKVPCLQLDHSFKVAQQNEVTLESGLSVPVSLSIEKLVFKTHVEHEISQENMLGVVKYGQRCLQLKTLAFHGKCVLPLSLTVETLKSNMNSRSITVFWQLLEYVFQLDVSTGKWRLSSTDSLTSGNVEPEEDVEMLKSVCSGGMALRRTDSRLLQRANIQFLEIASRHKIQITSLMLKSFSSADQNHVILESRNRVPVLPTLKELQIKTNLGKEFTQDQVIGILCFAQQCKKLQKISFIDCLLPLSLPVGSLSPLTKLHDIEVSWKPSKPDLHLDSSRGKWVLNSEEGITLETNGQNSLRRLCSSNMPLMRHFSKQRQMSTILLLEIASSHNIPISHLNLYGSFIGFDGKDIRLESGLSLSSLSSVEKISINGKGKGNTLSEEEVIGFINYGINSPTFKQLWLHNCKLPSSINSNTISEESRSRNIKVISFDKDNVLDLESGTWRKPDDIQTIIEMSPNGVDIDRDTSVSVQRSVIELLVEASNHDIPISRLNLNLSFSKIDEDGNIILSSGLSLPIITSIENMYIQREYGGEMNKHEVNGILNYLQHCQRFRILLISDCLLPSSIPVGPSLSTLKSRGVKVIWKPDTLKWHENYQLDLNSGLWLKDGSW
ncbi:uncharacterized protein [Apostichopus japonicus]